MSGGVPRSSRAGQRGSAVSSKDARIRKAANLYERFSGHEAVEAGRIKVPKMPDVGVAVGVCDFIGYTTVRDGVVEKYIHRFKKSDAPYFVVSPDGKQLLLVGGRFTFTERGIVDKSDKSR